MPGALHRRRGLGACLFVLIAVLLCPTGASAASYRDTVFGTSGLVSYWRLGETTGTSAADQKGLQAGSYNGTIDRGLAGALVGDTNPAINVNASTDFLSVPHRTQYNANAFTVEVWIRLNSYGDTTTYRGIASKGFAPSQRNWLIALGNNSTGQLTYGWGDGTVNHGRRSAATLELGKWYLLDFVHRPGSKMQMYINGQLDSEMADTSTPITSTQPIRLGTDQDGGYANARYDEFAVYNRDLSAAEIASHYQAANPAPAQPCDKVASPTGSDTAAGTLQAPYRTVQKLADSLNAGQTGCLRAGTYGNREHQMQVSRSGTSESNRVTLTSYPGERATIIGAFTVLASARYVTVKNLWFEGTNPTRIPSPEISGDNVTFSNNDVTNNHSAICFSPAAADPDRPENGIIENNRIHNCGELPPNNHEHGIYLTNSTNFIVRNNWIYDNADRGIQLYPDARGTQIYNNTVDGNGQGVIFGQTSADNVVNNNVIANSNVRWNIEWFEITGAGNVARDNCVYATNPGHTTDGGIQDYDRGTVSLINNTVGDPRYVNRAGKDFRLQAGSPCAGKGAQVVPGPPN